jgi:hypothetical protein
MDSSCEAGLRREHKTFFRFANAPHQVTHMAVAMGTCIEACEKNPASHFAPFQNCILNGIKLLSNRNKKSIWKRSQKREAEWKRYCEFTLRTIKPMSFLASD